MSNFSFTHSVFQRLVSQGRQKLSLCENGLTTQSPLLTTLKEKALENKTSIFSFPTILSTLSKREIINLVTSNFSSANVFNLVKAKTLFFDKELILYEMILSYKPIPGGQQNFTFKAFAYDKIKCYSKHKCLSQVRKYCGKRLNAGYQHLFAFPTVFSKGFNLWGLLSCHCVIKG